MEYTFKAPLWVYPGHAAWHFVTVPKDISQELKEVYGGQARGFGSIRVTICIGNSEWKTSIFPDSKSGCYFLPVKKAVRATERLVADQLVAVKLSVSIQ